MESIDVCVNVGCNLELYYWRIPSLRFAIDLDSKNIN